MIQEEHQECITDTLADAVAARLNVAAIEELLTGCPVDYPLSAGLFVGLMRSSLSHLENVVDGLRALNGAGAQTASLTTTLPAGVH